MKKYKVHVIAFIILLIAALSLIFAEQITFMMGYPSNEIVSPSTELNTVELPIAVD